MSYEEVVDVNEVLIIPCSGIGKTFGSIGREATYIVTNELRPNKSSTLCLSLLTMGDEESQQQVREHITISIDGCPKKCAKVNIEQSGGKPALAISVIDTYRAHRELKPGDVLDIGEDGFKLAQILAKEIASKIDELFLEEKDKKV